MKIASVLQNACSWVWEGVFPRTCLCCADDVPRAADHPLCARCREAFPVWRGLACRICGVPLPDGGARCFACRSRRRGFRFARSAGLLDGTLRHCIHRLKYEGRERLAAPLAERMAEVWRERRELQGAELLVPVPLGFFRERRRGYNQAERLASALSALIDRPVWPVLRRRRGGTSQTRLSRTERIANVRGAFGVRRGMSVEGRKLLLIDDVCTTGATLDECARALREAGATRVDALTAARGFRPRPRLPTGGAGRPRGL
jgi:ComF family protein